MDDKSPTLIFKQFCRPQPIPLIVFDWCVSLFWCTFPINAVKESASWDIPPRVAETLRYRVIYSTQCDIMTQSYFCARETMMWPIQQKFSSQDPRKPEPEGNDGGGGGGGNDDRVDEDRQELWGRRYNGGGNNDGGSRTTKLIRRRRRQRWRQRRQSRRRPTRTTTTAIQRRRQQQLRQRTMTVINRLTAMVPYMEPLFF